MPKYVLSLQVKAKLKSLLSVLRYGLPRFRIKGQNQRVTTIWRLKSIEIVRLNYKHVSICGPSKARTRLDNLTKIQSSNAWISPWNAQMLHFPLCRESVLGMPSTEIVLSSIWSSVLAYVWHRMLFFPLGFTHNTLHDLLKLIVL